MRIVSKFGGGTLKNEGDLERTARIIGDKVRKGDELVVVLSAVAGVTDSLIEVSSKALEDEKHIPIFTGELRLKHERLLEGVKNEGLKLGAMRKIDSKLNVLKRILYGVCYLKELSPRAKDWINSFGERLSVIVMEAHLKDRGIKCNAFDADEVGMITSSDFGDAIPLMGEIETRLNQTVTPMLKETVIVITGYFGVDKKGNVTTFGRGGSDFSASIIASAIGADFLEIWKDVPGFMSADPKVVKGAKLIKKLGYEEAEELGYFGTKILHPRTVIPIRDKKMKIVIKSVFEPDVDGTVISEEEEKTESVLKAVAVKRDMAMITVRSSEIAEYPGMAAKLFSIMNLHGINVDAIATSEIGISFTIRENDLEKAKHALVSSDLRIERLLYEDDVSLVGVVGSGILNTPNITGKLFSALGERGINIEFVTSGASDNISFVVKRTEVNKVIESIHEKFLR
ncbi:aspartate kinase [Candidatus Micrarchaeota archaeon]|nr:aspartate kinase [Candidatus Micrarchaeota archaeon]